MYKESLAMAYNYGTGLADIEATFVRTPTLATDEITSESGVISMGFSALTDVVTLNGVEIVGFSNEISGRIVSLSNFATATSNAAFGQIQATNIRLDATSNTIFPLAFGASNIANTTASALVSTSNFLTAMASFGSNTATSTSNVFNTTFTTTPTSTSNIRATFITNVASCSNLEVTQGVIRVDGSNLVGTDRKIDYNTWLKNGPQWSNDNSMAVAGLTLGAAGLLSSLGGQLLSQTGQVGPAVASDLAQRLGEDALDEAYDASQSESNILVHFNSLTYVPFHRNLGGLDIACASNLYVNSNASLWSIRSSDLTRVDGGRFRRIAAAPSVQKVIDFARRDFFGNDMSLCNLSASNTVSAQNFLGTSLTAPTVASSNISATNVSTSNLLATNVSTGGLWLGASGVWTQNPSTNPLTAVQVIDSQGNYLGTVTKDQVINTEALDFGALADGVLSLQGFSPTGAFVDPFAISAQPALVTLL
jgi:hypothetical protein